MNPNELSGRELDFAIWYDVMAYPKEREVKSIGLDHGPDRQHKTYEAAYADWAKIPAFSSDWEAARLVVEKVNAVEEKDLTFRMAQNWCGCGWSVEIEEDRLSDGTPREDWEVGYGQGETLPEAICRAALAWARGRKGC